MIDKRQSKARTETQILLYSLNMIISSSNTYTINSNIEMFLPKWPDPTQKKKATRNVMGRIASYPEGWKARPTSMCGQDSAISLTPIGLAVENATDRTLKAFRFVPVLLIKHLT